jgi:hypothetical protein
MSTIIEQLPTLGVGASLGLSSKPDPVSLLNSAGAADEILQGIEAGFQQLLSTGILELV